SKSERPLNAAPVAPVQPIAALIPEITSARKKTPPDEGPQQPDNLNVEIKDLMAEIFAQPTIDIAPTAVREKPEENSQVPDLQAEIEVNIQSVVQDETSFFSQVKEEIETFVPDDPEPTVSLPNVKQNASDVSARFQADDTLPPFDVTPPIVQAQEEVSSAADLYPTLDFEVPKVTATVNSAPIPSGTVSEAPDPPSESEKVVAAAPMTIPEASVPKVPTPVTPPVTAARQAEPVFVLDPEPVIPPAKPEPLPTQPLFPNQLETNASVPVAPTIPPPESPLFPNSEKRDALSGGRERHRLTPKRTKGEIPVPGPDPDPLSIQRITVVHPRPDKRVLSFYEPKHHICEEYRLLGKNLLHTFANTGEITRRGKVVTLTSSIRGEGKTLTSINLSLNMADDLKNRILLIDGDLRHPKVHKYLGLPGQTGLNDLINSADPKSILEDCIVRTESGLHCLFSQATRENPAPMLDTPRMSEILELLRDRYSVIIIDTPPVLLATDSLVLGSRSDGVLFILRARKTKREQIQEARQRIARLEIRMLGYVINNVKTFLPKIWSRYYYGNY
ncbi:TPA: hypothetical protein DDW35_13365, partial [Candidatus Sumerlaeota bacterium]|nr:hypothetical protein [Candidatus Sumerlaeota bacterium]